jgi:hypothetical protein
VTYKNEKTDKRDQKQKAFSVSFHKPNFLNLIPCIGLFIHVVNAFSVNFLFRDTEPSCF